MFFFIKPLKNSLSSISNTQKAANAYNTKKTLPLRIRVGHTLNEDGISLIVTLIMAPIITNGKKELVNIFNEFNFITLGQ